MSLEFWITLLASAAGAEALAGLQPAASYKPCSPYIRMTDCSSAACVARTAAGYESHDDDEEGGGGRGAQQRPCKHWVVRHTFDGLTYWNHDTAPSRSDQARRVFDWMEVATQVSRGVGQLGVTCGICMTNEFVRPYNFYACIVCMPVQAMDGVLPSIMMTVMI